MRSRQIAAALLALTATAAAAEGQKESGVALEIRLGVRAANVSGSNNNVVAADALTGGFVLGYKIGRFLVGLGFDMTRLATGMSGNNRPDTSTSTTAFRFLPTLAVAALRSSDGRVELFGEFQFGIGWTDLPNSPANTSNYQIGYSVGPGLRLWATPRIAFGAFAGVAGEFSSTTTTTNIPVVGSVTQTNTTGVTAIVANLRVMGVFF